MTGDELPVFFFSAPEELEAWLEENHQSSPGVWLKIAKKGAMEPSVTHAEALELALAFGWIDSQRHALDDQHFLQRFTPRRPRGRWSRINREKAKALITAGRMRPMGMAEVEAAKADGRWEAAYEGQRTAQVPLDLQRELDANPAAKEFFAGLDSANRYAILYRLEEAKKPETRERRLPQIRRHARAGREDPRLSGASGTPSVANWGGSSGGPRTLRPGGLLHSAGGPSAAWREADGGGRALLPRRTGVGVGRAWGALL